MTAVIAGARYRIEFSYRRREGKNASLARNSPIEGVACCAIVADGPQTLEFAPVVSVAAVVCSAGDNFSRREGRRLAFRRAVNDCGMLRAHSQAFFAWFAERFPTRAKPAHVRTPLSPEAIARLRDEGRARKAATAASPQSH